jgi:hypothetical protein
MGKEKGRELHGLKEKLGTTGSDASDPGRYWRRSSRWSTGRPRERLPHVKYPAGIHGNAARYIVKYRKTP